MTDVPVAESPTASALAQFLASAEGGLSLAAYRGVLTPVELDAPPSEIEALARTAAVHDLGWQRRIQVKGEDRFRWLSGMVTNTVTDLPTNGGAWNLVLNAQGRIQGDLTVWRANDELELEVAASEYDRLLAHLEHFIIMDDVELAPWEADVALGLTGPRASEVLAQLGIASLSDPMSQTRAEWAGTPVLLRRGYGVLADHYALWTSNDRIGLLWQAIVEAGATRVGSRALDAFRIAEGIPAYGVDIMERDLAQETSQLRALHFNKGCYLGQEIVERIRSRGNVHRHLRSLEIEGPLPAAGATLRLEGSDVGHFTSAAELPLAGKTRCFGLGMIRSEAEARSLPLTYTAGEATGVVRILAAPPQI